MKENMNNEIKNDTTTLEDLQAIRDAELEYCYEMEISIEDANL